MSRGSAFRNFLMSLLLFVGAAAFVAYSYRSATVTCRRPTVNRVDCADVETIAGRQVWTATVSDAALTRRPADSEGNPGAVYIEDRAGQQTQFTSGALGANEERVDTELHQYFVVRTSDPALTLSLAPSTSWRDWLPEIVFMAVVMLFGLYSLFRIFVPSVTRARKMFPSRG
jgi:hypothetical protein